MSPSAAPHSDATQVAPRLPGVGLALAALVAPPLGVLAPAGMAPLMALVAAALLASGWRDTIAAARPYAGILALLALGVFISFRIFAFPDITADGSLTLGASGGR